jgi:hypothetical protein
MKFKGLTAIVLILASTMGCGKKGEEHDAVPAKPTNVAIARPPRLYQYHHDSVMAGIESDYETAISIAKQGIDVGLKYPNIDKSDDLDELYLQCARMTAKRDFDKNTNPTLKQRQNVMSLYLNAVASSLGKPQKGDTFETRGDSYLRNVAISEILFFSCKDTVPKNELFDPALKMSGLSRLKQQRVLKHIRSGIAKYKTSKGCKALGESFDSIAISLGIPRETRYK